MEDNFTKLTKDKFDVFVKIDSIFNTVPKPDEYFSFFYEGTPVDETGKTIIIKDEKLGYTSNQNGIVLLSKERELVALNKNMYNIQNIDPTMKYFRFSPRSSSLDIPDVLLSKNEINEKLILKPKPVGGSRRGHNKYNKYNKYNNCGKSENTKRVSTTRRALLNKRK